ncbi:hypothetical protein CVU75_02355 [Candidatus Dependentiae bacterium HGW-Dependentiae-1]|nr:MAG: hypothetical protein CVU75_02355 [Candidatus Dependentiae bacterium HGW-Dependentiae-1]
MRKIAFFVMATILGNCGTLIGKPLSTNRLAIILDESEGMGNFEGGAMIGTAFALFIQKSTPFIMSTALWDWIALQGHIVRDIKTLHKRDFDARHSTLRTILTDDYDIGIQALKLTMNTLEAYRKNETDEAKMLSRRLKKLLTTAHNKDLVQGFAESTLLTARVHFSTADWQCTQFDNGRFLLFVPKAYAQKMGGALGLSTTKGPFPTTLLDVSRAWQRLEKRFNSFTSGTQENDLGAAFLKTVDTLFEKSDTQATAGRWAIYLIGHGEQEKEEIRYEKRYEIYELKKTLEDNQEDLAKELDTLYKEKSKTAQRKISQPLQKSIQKREKKISTLKQKIQRTTQRLNDILRTEEKVQKLQPFLASLSIAEFKTLLTYLSKKIDTTVFAYMTCFSAGSNLYKVYQHDQEQHIIDQYPFVIGSAGVAAGITYAPEVSDFDNYPPEETAKDILQYKNPTVRAIANYDLFFSLCEKDEPVDWAKAFNAIFAYTKFPASNLPLVKFPGTEWFTVPALEDTVISLSKVLAATREPDNALVLKNQKALLVYAPEIPFDIQYAPRIAAGKTKEAPVYVSMIPGYAHHALTNIHAPDYEASRVLKSFFGFPDAQNEKIFSIDSLQVTNDIFPTIPDKTITLYDVYCINHAKTLRLGNLFSSNPQSGNMIFFTLNDTAYGWTWPSEGDILFSAQPPENIDQRYVGFIHFALEDSARYRILSSKSQEKSYTPAKEEFTPAKRELLKKVIEKQIEEIRQQNPTPQQSMKMKKQHKQKKVRSA